MKLESEQRSIPAFITSGPSSFVSVRSSLSTLFASFSSEISMAVERPPWLNDFKEEILQNQNDNQRKTDASIADMTKNLALITSRLVKLKTEVTGVATRLKVVEERTMDTTSRVDEMEIRFAQFKRDMYDQFDNFTQQVQQQASPQDSGDQNSVRHPLHLKAPTYPSISRYDRLSDLMCEAEEKRCHFFFGPVKDSNNKPTKPTVSSSEIIRRFFSTVSLESLGPIEATYRRVSVDRKHYSKLKAKAREHSGDMKALGWWLAPECLQRL